MNTNQRLLCDWEQLTQRTPDCDQCRLLTSAEIAAHERVWWVVAGAWSIFFFVLGFLVGRAAAFWL